MNNISKNIKKTGLALTMLATPLATQAAPLLTFNTSGTNGSEFNYTLEKDKLTFNIESFIPANQFGLYLGDAASEDKISFNFDQTKECIFLPGYLTCLTSEMEGSTSINGEIIPKGEFEFDVLEGLLFNRNFNFVSSFDPLANPSFDTAQNAYASLIPKVINQNPTEASSPATTALFLAGLGLLGYRRK